MMKDLYYSPSVTSNPFAHKHMLRLHTVRYFASFFLQMNRKFINIRETLTCLYNKTFTLFCKYTQQSKQTHDEKMFFTRLSSTKRINNCISLRYLWIVSLNISTYSYTKTFFYKRMFTCKMDFL